MIAPLISIHGQKIIVAWIIPHFTPCVHGCQPPSLPAKAAQALGERLFVKHRISRYACPSPSLARTKTRTRSLHDPSPSGWVADIVLVIMRIHMHREESLYICVYTHRYIYIYRKCTVLHAETRKETRGSRDPLLPSTFLFERQSRHAMIFHFPRHPPWNTSTPVVERGIEIDPRELEPPVGG